MNRKNQGQILVVVILILFIISIIVLGIIVIVSNDVEQSVGAEQYELSYNKSEESIQKILTNYADTNTSLAGLTGEVDYSCSAAVLEEYSCMFDHMDMETTVNITDSNEVEDFELGKDETFKVLLGDYEGVVEVEWTGDVAMLFQLDYQTVTNEYRTISDMHDAGNHVTTGSLEHPMNINIPVQSQNRVIIDLDGIKTQIESEIGIGQFQKYSGFKIKALMKENENVSTLLSVKGNVGFPIQVRKLEAISYPENAEESAVLSVPVLSAQIPFAGSEPEIMNYVIRAKSDINK
ncbi:hypothetical protein GF389_04525 [Candidatus Dojkabacteria bacterium]|nr:hypothetical protein [Candidatus Dojkabacteria bacterium]